MTPTSSPPPADAQQPPGWEERLVEVDGVSTLALLLDDAGSDGATAVLPGTAAVARDDAGQPRFALTLGLQRSPAAADETIAPLIVWGRLTAAVQLGAPSALIAALHAADGQAYAPIFARSARLALEETTGGCSRTLASVEGAGPQPQVTLVAYLDRDQALATLAALDGGESSLVLHQRIAYRAPTAPRTIRLSAAAVDVYDAIDARVDRDGAVSRAELADIWAALVADGVVIAAVVAEDGRRSPFSPADDPALLDAFLRVASYLLDRTTPLLPLADPANRYAPRARPHPAVRLDVGVSVDAPTDEAIERRLPLEEILGGLLDGRPRDRFIHLTSIGADGRTRRSPRLVRGGRPAPGGREKAKPLQLAARDDRATSLAFALTPAQPLSAHALLSSDLAFVQNDFTLTGDLVCVFPTDGEEPVLPLPVVDDLAAPLWRGRLDAGSLWYAPTFELIQPAPDADPSTSPFSFDFERAGVVAGGNLQPGLQATVTFTLRPVVPPAVTAALAERGDPPAQAVPLDGLSVALDVPFREAGSEGTRSQRLWASVERRGEQIVASVELLDDWVRLCYGALAYPGFQAEPARVSVAFAFRAYVPLPSFWTTIVAVDKIAISPLVATVADLPSRIDRPIFVADDLSLHLPGGSIRLAREQAVRADPLAARSGNVATALMARPGNTVLSLATPALHHAVAAAQPALELAPPFIDVLPRIEYATETIGREERLVALFPCASLGGLYRQGTTDGGSTAAGCQDALRLGEVAFRQYDEIAELRDPRYRVFRSLQQPGRFLLLPAAYRITRYDADDPGGRAYRPAAIVYARLESDPSNNRYFFRATLQADVPPFARHALLGALQPYTPSGGTPQLDAPTEPFVGAVPAYRWSLPTEIGEPETLQTWDGFQVALSTPLADALLLISMLERDGVEGQVTFNLRDGTSLIARMVLDGAICGPWEDGPIETSLTGSTATLRNPIERAVMVSELVVRDAAGVERRLPVDRTLAPEEETRVALSSPAAAAWPVYAVAAEPLRLTERDVFVEDVTTNVLLINQVNFANHDLLEMRVELRLRGSDIVRSTILAEGATASIAFTLSLTDYLAVQTVEYRVTKQFTGDTPGATTAWREWNLTTQGIAIGLAWELIA